MSAKKIPQVGEVTVFSYFLSTLYKVETTLCKYLSIIYFYYTFPYFRENLNLGKSQFFSKMLPIVLYISYNLDLYFFLFFQFTRWL